MELKLLTSKSDERNKVIRFADSCSWKAGKSLADEMRQNNFQDRERVIVATEQGNIIGYCTVKKE